MSFSRTTPTLLSDAELDAAMRSIGMRVGTPSQNCKSADIEVTLVSVAAAALPTDYRLLSVLTTWFDVHHARVNVPRLHRMISQKTELPLLCAFWSAVGSWLERSDARWNVFTKQYAGNPLELEDPEITELQLQRLGPDPRFAGSALRIHAKLLRLRPSDVESPVELASHHHTYLKRIELGASYRADVWAALDEEPSANPAAIARRVGCAYETARSVAEDWRLARLATRAA